MGANIKRLVSKMENQSLDAIIACTRENIRYFAGFDPVVKILNPYSGQCYAVITAQHPEVVHIVHSIGEIDQVLDATSQIGEVMTYGTFYREDNGRSMLTEEEQLLKHYSQVKNSYKNGEEALQSLLTKLHLHSGRIGIDEEGINLNVKQFLVANLPTAAFIPSSRMIKLVRAVKTSEEVAALSYAAQCIEQAVDTVAAEIYEGISEREILRIFNYLIISKGANPYLPMLKIGRHAVGGQRLQREDNKLQAGDLIWFDCDIVCDGYWADIARVLFFKEFKPKYQKYKALYKGQLAAIEQIKPGMSGEAVFQLTMQSVHEAGFQEYRRHHVGHGIGLEPYELPILAPSSEEVVEEGMVLSIETPYYEFGLGALHVEDPVYIQESGNKMLTQNQAGIQVVEGK
ncbi:Xaa-Pro peptidase family protein [Bacillus sp. CLL-7-23]|uniref:Xaa-Pro peptidase family protein n=1 Tax=Bacillus changyiensis TaxID=3004103 RepID=A0ABT4X249_9BACI|nr:Xaa-Pro peptidase family protein [Bacillus changyiensis]MDA7026351.1 Xaa-Pro peptidase family protein [Bacillus changyiensis]